MNVCIVTKSGKGYGYGHLRRSNVISDFLNSCRIETKIFDLFSSGISNLEGDLVIVDAREFEIEELRKLLTSGKVVISIDDTETYKPYLISIMSLPYISTHGPLPNYEGTDFLIIDPYILNLNSQKSEYDLLITFGGEDPNGLTELVLSVFEKSFSPLPIRVCVIIGKLFRNRETVIERAQNLGFSVIEPNHPHDVLIAISKSKIVLTSFGITVYESLLLGKKVMLLNNSDYHELLFRRSQFDANAKSLGVYKDFEMSRLLGVVSDFLVSNNEVNINIKPLENLMRIKNIVELAYSKSVEVLKYACFSNHNVSCMYRDSNCSKFICMDCGKDFTILLR